MTFLSFFLRSNVSFFVYLFYLAVYVDEIAGFDENEGTEASPLKTALKALEKHGESIKIVVKKDEEGYKDISGAALKKAKKGLVELQRKLKKQEEQKKKQEEDLKKKKEEEAKALEQAKSIVLTEDTSLPKAQKVNINYKYKIKKKAK